MRDLLVLLEQDARRTPAQLAELTGLPENQIAEQIQEWEKGGVIRRYKTVVDWERYGDEKVFAFIDVSVTPERGTGFDDVAARIYRFPEVHSVYLVSGAQDLRVVVQGRNMKEVANFVAEKLATIELVNSTTTHFLLKKYKDDGDLFTEAEVNHRLVIAP